MEQICKCELTKEWMKEQGIQVEEAEMSMGTWKVTVPGMKWDKAVKTVIKKGLVDFWCPHASASTKKRIVDRMNGIPTSIPPRVDQEVLEFLLATKEAT